MVELHLNKYNVTLIADERKSLPSLRTIRIFKSDEIIGYIKIDERSYNTFASIDKNGSERFISDPLVNYLRDKFRLLKKSNPNYGDFEDGYDKLYGYLGSEPLYVEDFFSFLKSDNRDILISDILNNEHN